MIFLEERLILRELFILKLIFIFILSIKVYFISLIRYKLIFEDFS